MGPTSCQNVSDSRPHCSSYRREINSRCMEKTVAVVRPCSVSISTRHAVLWSLRGVLLKWHFLPPRPVRFKSKTNLIRESGLGSGQLIMVKVANTVFDEPLQNGYLIGYCIDFYGEKMVPERGVEPPTYWLRISCSTNWAIPARMGWAIIIFTRVRVYFLGLVFNPYGDWKTTHCKNATAPSPAITVLQESAPIFTSFFGLQVPFQTPCWIICSGSWHLLPLRHPVPWKFWQSLSLSPIKFWFCR